VQLLDRSKRVGNLVFGDIDRVVVAGVHLGSETRSDDTAVAVSLATNAEELWEPVLAVVHVYSHGKSPVPLDDVEVADHSRCAAANLKVGPSQRVVDLVNVIADVDGASPAVEADRVDVLDRDAVRTGELDHVVDARLECR